MTNVTLTALYIYLSFPGTKLKKTSWISIIFSTLKTNISPLKRATVLKLPSQMFGFVPGGDGLSPRGGLGGLGCLSCFLSEVEWILRTGRVGKGLVGSRGSIGGPRNEKKSVQQSHNFGFPMLPSGFKQIGWIALWGIPMFFMNYLQLRARSLKTRSTTRCIHTWRMSQNRRGIRTAEEPVCFHRSFQGGCR